MTVIFSGAARRATADRLGGFVRWIGFCAAALAARWERRAAVKVLRERDDRELRDIGLARWQIEAAVGGALNPAMGRLDESQRYRSVQRSRCRQHASLPASATERTVTAAQSCRAIGTNWARHGSR
jgi:uncharacterized protein YjiS (DUF1127 family)